MLQAIAWRSRPWCFVPVRFAKVLSYDLSAQSHYRFWPRGAVIYVLLAFLLLGCQAPPQTQQLLATPPNFAPQHQIAKVPFYPQQQYFCGPTTLAEVANFYGQKVTPETIAPKTFIPDLEGTLQIEMTSATRQLGLVAYAERGSMLQLLALVADNIPVIVLQNNSVAWLPRWHYAVVIGYDLPNQQVILHSGITEAYRLDIATFERTWQRGNYWLLAMLPPHRANQSLTPFVYTKAAQDLLNTKQTPSGAAALATATQQWPDYWLPYFLLGNFYYSTEPKTAAYWFSKGQGYAKREAAYLNNHAMLLSELGCQTEANTLINEALAIAPADANLLDSKEKIQKAAATKTVCQLKLP